MQQIVAISLSMLSGREGCPMEGVCLWDACLLEWLKAFVF